MAAEWIPCSSENQLQTNTSFTISRSMSHLPVGNSPEFSLACLSEPSTGSAGGGDRTRTGETPKGF
jgi:hypothetical protein